MKQEENNQEYDPSNFVELDDGTIRLQKIDYAIMLQHIHNLQSKNEMLEKKVEWQRRVLLRATNALLPYANDLNWVVANEKDKPNRYRIIDNEYFDKDKGTYRGGFDAMEFFSWYEEFKKEQL